MTGSWQICCVGYSDGAYGSLKLRDGTPRSWPESRKIVQEKYIDGTICSNLFACHEFQIMKFLTYPTSKLEDELLTFKDTCFHSFL
jgi:hypothetical protein